MYIVCSDLEGVLVPEIWIGVAEKTGIEELKLTTREIADYDQLMRHRLSVMNANGLKLNDITEVIETIDPLEGAAEFLSWLRSKTQVIIVSDTFTQFAAPLMKKLDWPTIFCNWLTIGPDGTIEKYHLRQEDGKRKVVEALQQVNFKIAAMGDSYNDITMIQAADHGILFRPPENITAQYPQLKAAYNYDDLKSFYSELLNGSC